ncbi:MAG: 3-oxoacyl-ACP synthase III [Myxococcales bacterium]|nr:3-oxoacyl-ACP synthase III [Myxococcales bacterium]
MSEVRYERVAIESIAHVLPEEVISTSALEARLEALYRSIGLKPGLLEALTGVAARRLWPRDMGPADAATLAAKNALQLSSISKRSIGAVVFTGVSKDMLEPSMASKVHRALRLSSNCINFDVGNACLGFLTGLSTVASMIELGQIEAGMVVAGESSRSVTEATVERLSAPGAGFSDLRDEMASLTLGSGAAAMILTRDHLATLPSRRLTGGAATAATEHADLCQGTMTRMRTDATKLLSEGVKVATTTWKSTQARFAVVASEVAAFCLHQVGKANHDAIIKALGIPPERSPRIYPELGNIGAASVPIGLSLATQSGLLKSGGQSVLMGIGSGLNSWMMVVEW